MPALTALEVIGPFRGATGHDRHTREFVRHLLRQGVRVRLTALQGWSAPLPESMREPAFDALGDAVDADVVAHFTMPTLCRPRAGKINVNYTMFEADRIPREWAMRAAEHERIIVPTTACRSAWIAGGVAEERLRIAPLGVDGDFFAASAEPLAIQLPNGRPVASYRHRFLNIAELRPRKNHLGLLRTWAAATRSDDDAVLIVKCTSASPHTMVLFQRDVVAMQQQGGRPLRDAAPVVFTTAVLSEEQLRALYHTATHYISMSFGEGWDFPMIESAAAGLQLIAPRHSSYCEYLTDRDATMIPAARVPAVIEGQTGAEDRRWFDGTCWWKPDEEAAAEAIRRIIDGRATPHAS
ncbi:MAG TPA: hypothetical protein VFV49_11965, partial [Thermoanaerobaculia bacterium]|nr:hypothetical protein [Thermoanaerobaculia bacterium]